MKGFFDLFIYYTIVIVALASLSGQSIMLEKALPDSCSDLPLEGRYVWLPKSVGEVFDGSTINLHFSTIRGKIDVWGKVQNGRIAPLRCGRSQNYDYEIWMSDVDAISLATSDEPISTFQQLRRGGRIEVDANGEENERRLEDAEALENEDDEPVPGTIQGFFGAFGTANLLILWPF